MKNNYTICNDTVIIDIIYKGEVYPCKIDLQDFELINSYNYRWKYSDGYAKITTTVNGKWINIDMHQLIYGPVKTPGNVIDHIDLDKMNNKRSNLQELPRGKNAAKQKPRADSKSGMVGVHRHRNKWKVLIKVNGTNIWGGDYTDLLDAKRQCTRVRLQHCPHTVVRESIKIGDPL